jgi:metallo-beta-lactamase class B
MRRIAFYIVAIVAIVFIPLSALAQPSGWNDPFPPHKVMDNFYYVGTTMLSSFLLTTPEGHILVNGGYESTVPVIRAGVEELGFDFEDIQILISVHAHPDHAESDALIKELTGADVVTSRAEAPDLRTYQPDGKEHPIDRMLDDGDTVTLGGTTLTAHLMPGHTKGCTAFSMELEEDGQTYQALIECSLNGGFVQLVGNEDYPEIADDFAATFARARTMDVDLFVSSHGVFYGLDAKYEQLQARGPGDPNPFVDPEGYQAHLDEYETIFNNALEQQRSEAGN